MSSHVKPVPEGYHTATPYLTVNDAARAIEFYKKAFEAQEIMRMEAFAGKIGHAELRIGDSVVMLSDEMPGGDTRSPQSVGGTTSAVFLYVPDVDKQFQQAVSAGAKSNMEPTDMFWGDRFGKLTDPFGHSWSLATHKENVSQEEMARRGKEAMAKMAQQTRTAS